MWIEVWICNLRGPLWPSLISACVACARVSACKCGHGSIAGGRLSWAPPVHSIDGSTTSAERGLEMMHWPDLVRFSHFHSLWHGWDSRCPCPTLNPWTLFVPKLVTVLHGAPSSSEALGTRSRWWWPPGHLREPIRRDPVLPWALPEIPYLARSLLRNATVHNTTMRKPEHSSGWAKFSMRIFVGFIIKCVFWKPTLNARIWRQEHWLLLIPYNEGRQEWCQLTENCKHKWWDLSSYMS